MVDQDYKFMSDEELSKILRQIYGDVERVIDRVINVLPTRKGRTWGEEHKSILAEYAAIKSRLKQLNHYISLARNAEFTRNYYFRYFCPAVYEAYVHCVAKVNEADTNKLLNTLYDVQDDLDYYLSPYT